MSGLGLREERGECAPPPEGGHKTNKGHRFLIRPQMFALQRMCNRCGW